MIVTFAMGQTACWVDMTVSVSSTIPHWTRSHYASPYDWYLMMI